MTDDLGPLPRLSARQLHQLAESLRRQAGETDRVTHSVAEALESVSRRRVTGTPLAMVFDASFHMEQKALTVVRSATEFTRSCVTWVENAAMRGRELAASAANSVARQAVQRRTSAPGMGSKTMSMCPSTIKKALTAVEQGRGLSPEVCDALVAQRWVEWVDHALGTPIDPYSPRSVLRLTEEGRRQLDAEAASSNESAFGEGRLTV